jgi:hypothetical protein
VSRSLRCALQPAASTLGNGFEERLPPPARCAQADCHTATRVEQHLRLVRGLAMCRGRRVSFVSGRNGPLAFPVPWASPPGHRCRVLLIWRAHSKASTGPGRAFFGRPGRRAAVTAGTSGCAATLGCTAVASIRRFARCRTQVLRELAPCVVPKLNVMWPACDATVPSLNRAFRFV